MQLITLLTTPLLLFVTFGPIATARGAEAQVEVEVNSLSTSTAKFEFRDIPAPSVTDAGNLGEWSLPAGRYDRNGQEISCLVDGLLAKNRDDPARCFFFASDGGRMVVDLSRAIDVQQVNTYSWHTRSRAPQVYTLWGAGDASGDWNAKPRRDVDLATSGWTKIATVDTRGQARAAGGQVGVSIYNKANKQLGSYRYLLFDVKSTDPNQVFNNTFFTEIDIVDGNEYPRPETPQLVETITTDEGVEIVFDMTGAPLLHGWVTAELVPIVKQWYPKIVAMLPSEDYTPPQKFVIYFDNSMDGVAYTLGQEIHCGGVWFRRNLKGEAAGAVVHELVHMVQQYRSRRGRRNPTWLVEGVADYIRWFLYEPKENQPRPNFSRANYNDSYKTTGAFLNYVVGQHGEKVILQFNTAMREGRYDPQLWVDLTGKTAAELWKSYAESEKPQ